MSKPRVGTVKRALGWLLEELDDLAEQCHEDCPLEEDEEGERADRLTGLRDFAGNTLDYMDGLYSHEEVDEWITEMRRRRILVTR